MPLQTVAEEPAENLTAPVALWMAVIPITHVRVLPIRAIILPKVAIPMAQAIILRLALQEARLLTAHRHTTTVRLREASRITARQAEAIRLQEVNLTALRPGLTASRRTALLPEVTARHPAVEAAVAAVQAVLREVQDNLRLS